MKWIKYSKYTGEDLDIDANDLLQALSDYLLQSGFNDPYNPTGQWQEQSLEDLKDAILRALEDGKLFPGKQRQEMLDKLAAMSPEQLEKLIESLIRKLIDSGNISTGDPQQGGNANGPSGEVKFQVTDKSLDFLGF